MTCVAALSHGGHVYIMADSASTSEDGTQDIVVSPSKLVQRGCWGFGIAGEWSLAKALRKCIPPNFDGMSLTDNSDLLTEWVASVAAVSKAADWALLCASAGMIWVYDSSNPAGTRSVYPYAAIGTGAPYAVGALSALRSGQPWRRLEAAVRASAEHCSDVRGPFRRLRV